jgi:hypothetical protein
MPGSLWPWAQRQGTVKLLRGVREWPLFAHLMDFQAPGFGLALRVDLTRPPNRPATTAIYAF